MKCEHCGGAIIYKPGNSIEPAIYVCMACGREPKGKEKLMDEEKKICTKCGESKLLDEFGKNKQSLDGLEYLCRECRKIAQAKSREKKRKEAGQKPDKIRRKKVIVNSKQSKINQTPDPKIDDAILLDQQILKAIKKSVANQIIRIIEEAFA